MRLLPCLVFAASALSLGAEPLTKSLDIDFYREVPARNLRALATRSDGRVAAGPVLRELAGQPPADLLWTLAAAPTPGTWLVGTGPEGKIFEVTTSPQGELSSQLLADLDATHIFALLPLDAQTLLAGASPQGTVSLVRAGQIVASLALPADSVFDFARLADGAVLVATGNPGRIYRIDLAKFERAGVAKGKADAAALAAAGVTIYGEIRDRNVRRLLVLADDRVIAGSAPKGNVYAFTPTASPSAKPIAPLLLLENRDAEVTDLLADGAGAFYAAITLSGGSGESRVNRPAPATPAVAPGAPAPITPPTDSGDADSGKPDRFSGRGQLYYFPNGALPEIATSRANTAFYRLAWHGDERSRWVLISGGEQGELLAYSPGERRSYNLGAAGSAQVNALLPGATRGQFRLMRNNPAGFSALNFNDTAERSLETRKLDLGVAAELGQVRFAQVAGDAAALRVAVRTSFGSDELEGWSEWTTLEPRDGGWFAPSLRGRYVQLRVATSQPTLQLDKATLYYLPQNRRPQLSDFRIFPANLGLIPAGEQTPSSPNTTLGQLLFPPQRENKDDSAKRKGGLMNSPVVPAPGTQIVYWSLNDADDDALTATFSIAAEGQSEWTELAVDTTESFVQFEVSHWPEGRYRSRLVVREQAPRPAAQRLSHTFETDVLVVDRTPPALERAAVEHLTGVWRVTVEGRDALSLLEGAEFILNNGARLAVEHPADGVLDSQRETFVGEFTDAKAAGATSVEVIIYDKAGNSVARRLPLK